MTPRVSLRLPTLADCKTFLTAVSRSRSLHHPWVTPPRTKQAYWEYVKRFLGSGHCGFLVVNREDEGLVGVINVSHMIGGSLQSAFLSYYAFADYAGRGLMQEGMQQVLEHVFKDLKLHRLEANIQPGNTTSIALVKRCAFVREGFSRRYLKVGGRWKDHERWALLAEDWRGRKRRADKKT